MTKAELRNIYLEKRNQLDKKTVDKLSMKMAFQFFEYFTINNKTIHTFLSIPNSKEVNTSFIVSRLLEDDIKVATSTTHFKPKRLEHTLINRDSKFIPDDYGVPVPSPIIPVSEQSIDLILVPLLCVDNEGTRIGYGQGFYDGFLAKCDKNIPKIGLSFFDPMNETIERDSWDIGLTHCITPESVIVF